MSRSPWFWQTVALEMKVGHPVRKLILLSISRRVEVESGCGFVPQETLGEEAECSVRSVGRHVAELERAGFVRRYRRSFPNGGRAPDGFEILLENWYANLADRPSPTRQIEGVLPDSHLSEELPGEPPTSSPDGEDVARAKAEPLGFEDWLEHHAQATDSSIPAIGTKRRAQLAAAYGSLTADGFNPDDFIAATRAVTTEWHRERGHDSFETVLRKTEFGAKVRRGRAEALKDAERAPMREKYDGMDGAAAPVDPGVFD